MKSKIFAAVTGFALVLSVVAAPASASAQTIEELQAQIQALLAQVAALSGGTSGDFTFTSDLTIGSTGNEVMELQKFLNSNGYTVATTGAGSAGSESSYFGSLTAAALANYQAANGISPAVGYFGPITRASVNGAATSTTGGSSSASAGSTGLSGGAGDITLSTTSKYSAEEVGEGEEDVPVAAVDVEADNNSDVRINSVKVEFHQATAADDQDLDDYASDVSIWFDGDKVGSVDADEFSEGSSNFWSKTINLDSDVVIEADQEERLTVAVSALNNLDSGDIDTDDWRVDFLTIRFTDGDGVTISETVDTANAAAAGTYGQTFDFASFATANDAELQLALDDDDINDARVLDVDDTEDTDHEILSFTLEADGDADIWVDEIPVVITTTGETDESVIVIGATLFADGEDLGTEDVPAGGVATFDDLDMWIEAGDEVAFILEVELQNIDGALDDADTVQATVTVASIDAEDEAGDSVTADGTAVGDAHTVYEAGIMVELVSTDATAQPSGLAGVNDFGTFEIVFDVTAFDSDVFVDGTAIADEAGGATYQDIVAANIAATGVLDCADCADGANTTFKVDQNTTERFTLTMSGDGDDVFANAALESVLYALTAIDGDVVYNFSMEEFETANVFLSGND